MTPTERKRRRQDIADTWTSDTELDQDIQFLLSEIDRRDKALRFILSMEGVAFAECSHAEQIMQKAREALDDK